MAYLVQGAHHERINILDPNESMPPSRSEDKGRHLSFWDGHDEQTKVLYEKG